MMTQARFFSSDTTKGTPLVEETKKTTELPILNIDFKFGVKRAFYGPGSDLECSHQVIIGTDEKSQVPVICRIYRGDLGPRDHLYKKDIEIEQRIGHHPNLLRCIGVAKAKQFYGNALVYENWWNHRKSKDDVIQYRL